MKHALVFCSGVGANGEALSGFAHRPIAQVPQVKRIIINSQRAGIEQLHIVTDDADFLKGILENDPRITSKITWLGSGDSVHLDRGRVLVVESCFVSANSEVFRKFIVDSMQCRDDEVSALVRENSGPVVGTDAESGYATSFFGNAKNISGVFSVSSSEVSGVIESPGFNVWLDEKIQSGRLRTFGAGSGFCHRLLNSEESEEEAEAVVFSHVGKTATGWIARNINGRMSLPLSKLLIKTSLTPNSVSVLINLVGILCGPFYALGYPVLGAVFMQIATVLDRCDGEVARIKLMETKKGQWVDTASDQFTVLSFLIGVPLGYYLQTGSVVAVMLGIYNFLIFLLFLVWSVYFLLRYTDSGSLVAYFEIDKHINPDELSSFRKFIVRFRFLGRRNYYSAILVLIAIAGGNSLVLYSTSFVLTIFLLHQIEDAVRIFQIGKSEKSIREKAEQS